jgi:hypothetical protein
VKHFKYASKNDLHNDQIQRIVRFVVWRKFNMSYHLISLRDQIGLFNSGAWALLAALASGWLNGSLIGDRRLGLPRHISLNRTQNECLS